MCATEQEQIICSSFVLIFHLEHLLRYKTDSVMTWSHTYNRLLYKLVLGLFLCGVSCFTYVVALQALQLLIVRNVWIKYKVHRQSSLLYCLCKECNEIDFIEMFITSKSILFYKVKILNKIIFLSIFFKSFHYKTHSKVSRVMHSMLI